MHTTLTIVQLPDNNVIQMVNIYIHTGNRLPVSVFKDIGHKTFSIFNTLNACVIPLYLLEYAY